MAFINQAVTVLQTLVIALGAGLAVWGVVNLMEGYGNDNPGAKSQGIKHYSLSGACQGKTTSEPYGTRLSFETHRTGEPLNRPRLFKTGSSTHGESTKDTAEKRAKKSAELLSSKIPAR